MRDGFQAPHWNDEAGKTSNFIEFTFDELFDPFSEAILENSHLRQLFPEQQWAPQGSGIRVHNAYLPGLEQAWLEHLLADKEGGPIDADTNDQTASDTETSQEVLFEGAARVRVGITYERNRHARRLCVEAHGYACVACGFDLASIYGQDGDKFIHVHHLEQLADALGRRSVDPVQDLRPVCANCHAMIHRRTPALSIEAVTSMLNRKREP